MVNKNNFDRIISHLCLLLVALIGVLYLSSCNIQDQLSVKGTWKFTTSNKAEDMTVTLYGIASFDLSHSL